MAIACFGVLGSAMRLALGKNVPAYRLCETMLFAVTGEECSLRGRNYIVTDLFLCRRGLSNGEAAPQDSYTGSNRVSSVLKVAPVADREQVTDRVKTALLPLLDADSVLPLCACLLRIVSEDETVQSFRAQSFARYTGMDASHFLALRDVDAAEMIAELLLYSASCVDNREGAPFAPSVTREYFDAAADLFPKLRLAENGRYIDLTEYLEKSLPRARYLNTVFAPRILSDMKRFYVTNDIICEHLGRIEGICAKHIAKLPPRVYLEAEGGMGKSCLLRHLFVEAWENYPDCGVPLLAEMRAYDGRDVLSYIAQDAAPELSLEDVEALLSRGRCLLLLDGMDEVLPSRVAQLEKGISDLAKRYSQNRVIVSSRPCHRVGMVGGFSQMRLCPLREKQWLQVIERMPEEGFDPDVRRLLLETLQNGREPVPEAFTSNPLLLSILARTFSHTRKVPRETYQFYEAAYDSLSFEHDALKGYRDRPFHTGLSARQLQRVIALFCAYAYCSGMYSFSENDMEWLANAVRSRRSEFTADTDAFRSDLMENLCLMIKDKGRYRFLHRTFLDWFASVCFASQSSAAMEHMRCFWRDQCTAGQVIADRALFFLNDWEQDMTLRTVLLPTLEELTKDGFEGFVKQEYPTITYSQGQTMEQVTMQCKSMLYAFIREEFMSDRFVTLRNMPAMVDLAKIATLRHKDGSLEEMDVDYVNPLTMNVVGLMYKIDAEDMYADREQYIELIGTLAHQNSPLRKEYEKLVAQRDKMRLRLAKMPRNEIAEFLE